MLGRKLKVKVLDGGVPAYAHEGDAGLDLRATEAISIPAHGHATVGTGIACEVPSGCVGLVFPRSGLACKSVVALRNCVGVIDSGYRGEIKATLTNDTDEPFEVEDGDRIAQMVERLDARRVAEELASLCGGSKSIALMCYERTPEECHRHVVSEWMTESGITVVEWEPAEVVQERLQMSMF